MKIQLDERSAEFIKGLGDNVYVVGGYVRNCLCGFRPTDIDLAGPTPAQLLTLPRGATLVMVNHRMGTAQITYDGVKYEYTPFRTEVYDEGGAHTPSQVFFTDDINADAARRDFCCNAIYYSVVRDEIVDPLGGVRDTELQILRGCNKRVFDSDGLRLLRLVRLASELGFKIEGETAASAKAHAQNLSDITSERKRVELDKILCADGVNGIQNAHYRGLRLLKQLGLWQYLIPEVAECDGLMQPPEYHRFDVMEHSFRCVLYAPPMVNLRLAALLHDVGKAYCKKHFDSFHGHEKSSEMQARSILTRLRYPNDVIDQVSKLCGLHMYDMRGDMREAKVRVFVAKNYNLIDKLVALIRADRLATGLASSEEVGKPHRFEVTLQKMIAESAPILKRSLRISGKDLAEMGFESEAISSALDVLWRECIIDPKNNNPDWLKKMAERLPKKPEDLPKNKSEKN
ncbi:MAG: CCA tRNA nucleotidyltransferase [Clostridiales bacterium]|nr:CCA tRNA nucleotidyltransferase [Clostridiales bacterium]